MSDMTMPSAEVQTRLIAANLKQSKWRCEMYGLGPTGVVLRPSEGNEPNWFWRLMQRLLLGHKWIKETE